MCRTNACNKLKIELKEKRRVKHLHIKWCGTECRIVVIMIYTFEDRIIFANNTIFEILKWCLYYKEDEWECDADGRVILRRNWQIYDLQQHISHNTVKRDIQFSYDFSVLKRWMMCSIGVNQQEINKNLASTKPMELKCENHIFIRFVPFRLNKLIAYFVHFPYRYIEMSM
jgi:hypothetical protein